MRTQVRDDQLDIQVGSCIFLNVCLFWNIAYALRVIPLLSISSPCRGILFYKYMEGARRRLILETEL